MKKPKINQESIKFFILDIFFGGRQYKTTADTQKTPFPIATVSIAAITTVLLLSLIFSLIKISDLSAEIASLKRQTISLSSKKASLENELDHRYSFAEIIESAQALGYSENGGRVVYIETGEKEETPEETTASSEKTETENDAEVSQNES